MKSKYFKICLCFLGCLSILSGCVFNFVTPIPLTNGTWTATSPGLAVQANGAKHVVWQERGLNGGGQIAQVIVYERTKVGEEDLHYTFIPPSGFDYLSPDIAVTDNGYAYIVWQKKSQSDASIRYGCYDMVPPEGSAVRLCQELTVDPVSQIEDPPIVVARGAYVFALYNTKATTGIRIHYRQLRILDDSYGWASSLSTFHDEEYQAAIDSLGKLHITWTRTGGIFPSVFYNSNASIDAEGNMNRLRELETNRSGSQIAIAGTSPEEAFVIYDVCIPCQITIRHCGIITCANPMSELNLPLSPDPDSWTILSEDLGVINHNLFITFHATNPTTGLDNQEIYLYNYHSSILERITNNDVHDQYPSVVDSEGYPLLSFLTLDETDYILQIWDQLTGIRPIKKIEDATKFIMSHEMVSNNEWVAGIWLDNFSSLDDTATPWLSFNTYMVDLPLIVK